VQALCTRMAEIIALSTDRVWSPSLAAVLERFARTHPPGEGRAEHHQSQRWSRGRGLWSGSASCRTAVWWAASWRTRSSAWRLPRAIWSGQERLKRSRTWREPVSLLRHAQHGARVALAVAGGGREVGWTPPGRVRIKWRRPGGGTGRGGHGRLPDLWLHRAGIAQGRLV